VRAGFDRTEEPSRILSSDAQQTRANPNGWKRAAADSAVDGVDADLQVRGQFVRSHERFGMFVQIADSRHGGRIALSGATAMPMNGSVAAARIAVFRADAVTPCEIPLRLA
jgi:hypothetical protein